MDTKRCPRCETTKPVSAFYLNKGRPDGLSGYCVECQKVAEAVRKAASRLGLIRDLGGKCVTCGFSDHRALQIDHVNSDGRLDRIEFPNSASPRFYSKVRANPDRYALVCANCNWIKRHEQQECVGKRVYERQQPEVRQQSGGRWSAEANAKRSVARKAHMAANPEAEAERAKKMSERTKGRKMVTVDGKRRWAYPGDPAYPAP
jgi:hypothetical protein